ncbi:MAG: flagellar biosynthetic protein FliR [Desulfosarcinaceae bacterium]|nr:flagellar biosynthetic protein FliR [Desulfosarcinaceae bacterium]
MLALNLSLGQLQTYLVIFLRVSAILFVAPVFDSRTIPILFKVGLAISISLLLYPVVQLDSATAFDNLFRFVFWVGAEIALGVVIGMSVKMFFAGIQLAGQFAGFQMGLAIANVMDPASSAQMPILAQFKNLFAMLVFLATNAHHWFFRALVESFRIVPPFQIAVQDDLFTAVMAMAANIFVIAIKIGAPVIAAMLITSVAFGMLARTVPQMNVFIVAMPVKIVLGLIFLSISLPYIAAFLTERFTHLGRDLVQVISLMGG